MSIPRLFILAIAATIAPLSFACDMHGGAYGFNPHGFSGNARLAAFKSPFMLRTPSMTTVEPNREAEIEIKYTRPQAAEKVVLSVKTIGGVELLSKNQVTLTDAEGSQKIQFKSVTPGFHSLLLTISGIHDGKEMDYSERIYINSKLKKASI